MLRIEIYNKKHEKVVKEQDFIPARKVRQVFEIMDSFVSGEVTSDVEALDKKVEFVAGLFKNVTSDDIYDGIEAPKLIETLDKVIDQVLGREKKTVEDEK